MNLLRHTFLIFAFILVTHFCSRCFAQRETIRLTDSLEVVQISPGVWQHKTLQYYPAFGTFTSNGLIYRSGNEAVIMDTPASETQSRALLDWWNKTFPETKVKAVIVNHFHEDALGGLAVFHDAGIDSYGHRRTERLLRKENPKAAPPRNSFKLISKIGVGNKEVINFYPGPAHTSDNIVTWIPEHRVLFGGCMVKSVGAGKGNIADADLKKWTSTIRRVIAKFPDLRVVVPGHGPIGDVTLLEYTAELFSN